MQSSLTKQTAHDLGRALSFIRVGRGLTLREAAKRAGISSQYVFNLERGERLSASDEAYGKLARGLGVPEPVIANLVLKARLLSLLERYGLEEDDRTFVWRGIEQRLRERGHDPEVRMEELMPRLMQK